MVLADNDHALPFPVSSAKIIGQWLDPGFRVFRQSAPDWRTRDAELGREGPRE